MTIQKDVLLAPYTTFKVGGAARFFVSVYTLNDLQEALVFARDKQLPVLVLGGGSNMLVDDEGFAGVVLHICITGTVLEGSTLIAGAGEPWDKVVERAVLEGLWGIENLSGIPGSVGASPVQNIGAYGCEVKDTIQWVEVYDIEKAEMRRMDAVACAFGYRTSMFKRLPGRFIVLRVAFALMRDGKANASYKDLQGTEDLSLQGIRECVLSIRAQKFPDLAVEGTAGSFFLNPMVDTELAEQLQERYPALPQFKTPDGIKISLAWLLDHVLAVKGMQVGGARVFERQPLVLVTKKGATSKDVRELAKKITALVKETFGISVEVEVRIIL